MNSAMKKLTSLNPWKFLPKQRLLQILHLKKKICGLVFKARLKLKQQNEQTSKSNDPMYLS